MNKGVGWVKNNDEDNKGIFSFFTGLDKLINVVTDMVDNEKDEVFLKGDIKGDHQKKVVGKYGINVKLGADKIDGFRNLKFEDKIFDKNTSLKTVVPVTDVFEEEDKITIVSELPGVEREDIELCLDKNTVKFIATKKDVCYSKQIVLDFIPAYSSIQESLQNSIYSIIIRKNPLT